MAHSARLELRMQKELKLLATDPPPGVSIPSLSNHSGSDSSFSLSNIDARIEGPEGTVYAKGVFNIKIQIPDRYPFQPPNVTFSTPIYHPNIDNGGRICLDILNLPPKGAWQPSLNISTVLTSIGLLLSEPNPDDGLMCEASREYKYNRKAFDQKARSWTERYAVPGAVEGSSSSGLLDISNMVDGVDDTMNCQKKLRISGKLSLGTSVSIKRKSSDNKENEIQNDKKENIGPIKRLSLSLTQRKLADSSKSMKLLKSGHSDDEPLLQEYAGKTTEATAEQNTQVSDVPGTDSVDTARPTSLLEARSSYAQPHSLPGCVGKPARQAVVEEYLPFLPANSRRKTFHATNDNEQKKPVPDFTVTVIVSDSEESEEELERPGRSRLSLGRAPFFVGRRKS